MRIKQTKHWMFCPFCADQLRGNYACAHCDVDFAPFANPWYLRLLAKLGVIEPMPKPAEPPAVGFGCFTAWKQ